MRIRFLAGAVCLLALAGCNSGDDGQEAAATTTSTSSTTTTTTTLPPPGIDRFIAEIQASGYAERLGFSGDVNVAGRDAILRLADVVCDDIEGIGYESMVRVLMDTQAKPTEQQATAFVDSALRNICPGVRP